MQCDGKAKYLLIRKVVTILPEANANLFDQDSEYL
jgi:hypothetical protein